MSDHIRDTVFGQLVRLVSRKQVLRFPDELDTNLWKQCVQEDTKTASSTPEENNDTVEPHEYAKAHRGDEGEKGLEVDAETSFASGDINKEALDHANTNKTREVILISWYGADDDEVGHRSTVLLNMLTTHSESSELIFRSESACCFSNMYLELWDIHRKLDLHAWRAEPYGRI